MMTMIMKKMMIMTRIPLVMMVDSAAHNFQILHVKPRLYALFAEKGERVEANVRSQTPTLVWPSQLYNRTTTTSKQWILLFFFFNTKMPLVVHIHLKVVSTMHDAVEVTHRTLMSCLSLHLHTEEDA